MKSKSKKLKLFRIKIFNLLSNVSIKEDPEPEWVNSDYINVELTYLGLKASDIVLTKVFFWVILNWGF